MKTNKDTSGTKLKSGNENYGYSSDEPGTTSEWPGGCSGKIWKGKCRERG